MSIQRQAATKAFGVEEGHPTYRLRQARYYELATDIARLAKEKESRGEGPLSVLDVGTYDGVTRKYVEAQAGDLPIEWHGVDIFPYGHEYVHKHTDWQLYHCDLEEGLTGLPSNRFDVVVCEQVLEHLHGAEHASRELTRVLSPGGTLFAGVPIFPHGVHLVRKHLVPVSDRLLKVKKVRGHVQAFSLATFRRLVKDSGPMKIQRARGFRIISGGLLRPLEYCRWWWQLNRLTGSLVPSLCIETQIVAVKTAATPQPEAVAVLSKAA